MALGRTKSLCVSCKVSWRYLLAACFLARLPSRSPAHCGFWRSNRHNVINQMNGWHCRFKWNWNQGGERLWRRFLVIKLVAHKVLLLLLLQAKSKSKSSPLTCYPAPRSISMPIPIAPFSRRLPSDLFPWPFSFLARPKQTRKQTETSPRQRS